LNYLKERDANSLVLSDDLIVVVILAKQVEEEELVEAVTVDTTLWH